MFDWFPQYTSEPSLSNQDYAECSKFPRMSLLMSIKKHLTYLPSEFVVEFEHIFDGNKLN